MMSSACRNLSTEEEQTKDGILSKGIDTTDKVKRVSGNKNESTMSSAMVGLSSEKESYLVVSDNLEQVL